MSGYDERLLASAPAPTREQRQGGYNPDLLANGSDEGHTPPQQPFQPADAPHAEAAFTSKEVLEPYPRREVPWWRTKKWIAIFIIGAVVVIAAVVGGAVGGTVHKNNKNNSSNSTTSPSDGLDNGSPAVTSVVDVPQSNAGGTPTPSSDSGGGLGQGTTRSVSETTAGPIASGQPGNGGGPSPPLSSSTTFGIPPISLPGSLVPSPSATPPDGAGNQALDAPSPSGVIGLAVGRL